MPRGRGRPPLRSRGAANESSAEKNVEQESGIDSDADYETENVEPMPRGRGRPPLRSRGAANESSVEKDVEQESGIDSDADYETENVEPTLRGRGRGRGMIDDNMNTDGIVKNDSDVQDAEYSTNSLTHPSSMFAEVDMSKYVNFQNFTRFPKHVQDAFLAALPEVIKEQTVNISNGSVTEGFFNSSLFSKALIGWQKALSLGKFTEQYASIYKNLKQSFETDAQWKSDNFERYYGEKASRNKEIFMSAGESAKVTLIRIGFMRGIQVGDQIHYRRTFNINGAKSGDSEKRGRRGNLAKIATPQTDSKVAETAEIFEVDLFMNVVDIKATGKPCIQFEVTPTQTTGSQVVNQDPDKDHVQESQDNYPIYEVDTAGYLESLCLEHDGRVPKKMRKSELDPHKLFNVIRGTYLVGSLFAIRMDVHFRILMNKSREETVTGKGRAPKLPSTRGRKKSTRK
ncbi:putative Polycomb group protein asxl3 [Entomortierella beljakovae]|nr:putative Polycomb group protein asxl3 [Entomortierella beljakovae]